MAAVAEAFDQIEEHEQASRPREEGVSVLDALRAKRQQIAAAKPRTLTLDVPGYDGRLIVRYHYPDAGAGPVLEAARRSRESSDTGVQVDAACDLLIAACDEVYGRDEDGNDVPLDPSRDEQHKLKLGTPLGDMLGIIAPQGTRSPARFVVRSLFSPMAETTGRYEGDLALVNQGGRVAVWLHSAGEDIEEEFSGEA